MPREWLQVAGDECRNPLVACKSCMIHASRITCFLGLVLVDKIAACSEKEAIVTIPWRLVMRPESDSDTVTCFSIPGIGTSEDHKRASWDAATSFKETVDFLWDTKDVAILSNGRHTYQSVAADAAGVLKVKMADFNCSPYSSWNQTSWGVSDKLLLDAVLKATTMGAIMAEYLAAFILFFSLWPRATFFEIRTAFLFF